MPIDAYAQVTTLLVRDVVTTLGATRRAVVVDRANEVRALDLVDAGTKLVEDIQQYVHDSHIDTTWPQCPAHRNHPLWYSAGQWRCSEPDGPRVALGSLAP